jgi:hypothetical protein
MARVRAMRFEGLGLKTVMQNVAQDFKRSEKIDAWKTILSSTLFIGRRNCAHYTKSKYTGEVV